ncbi:MAG TPA: Xaa-Pro peptidase family protein [Thermoanaerobaculia bacterium]|nr:Xaa-Pro peptidase family protein [Thermoanaerobaculia bacterium]
MLADLDPLMQQSGIDTLIVPMHEALHPSFRWLSRGAKVTRGYAVKRAGEDPFLVTYPMEREEAAATGLRVHLVSEFDHERIFRESETQTAAYAQLFDLILRAAKSGKRISFLGNLPFHLYFGIAEEMAVHGWEIHRPSGEDLLQKARKRKDPWEIDAIASVGRRTEEVVDEVRAVLRESHIERGRVVYESKPLRLGDLKDLVSFEIARRGMIEDHETILSQGRDAAIPHSRGDREAMVEPSLPIVLDIFPLDRSSGYFFDLTRTFCVGRASEELRRLHSEVLEAFQRAAREMRPGVPASTYQAQTCDFFEERGHPTTRTNPATLEGYVHSLGHGVGLDIHEKPFFSLLPTNRDMIEVGDVVTIEPGLYYPDRSLGVRIEDTFVVEEGGVRSLCSGAYDLEP